MESATMDFMMGNGKESEDKQISVPKFSESKANQFSVVANGIDDSISFRLYLIFMAFYHVNPLV